MFEPKLPQAAIQLQCLFVRFDPNGVAPFDGASPCRCGLEKEDTVVARQLSGERATDEVEKLGCAARPKCGPVDRSSVAEEYSLRIERRLNVLEVPLYVKNGGL